MPNMPIKVDPNLPRDVVELRSGDVTVGRIVNLGPAPTITCPVCHRPVAQGDWPWCPHKKLTGPRAIYVR
jgi:hypothetical protein